MHASRAAEIADAHECDDLSEGTGSKEQGLNVAFGQIEPTGEWWWWWWWYHSLTAHQHQKGDTVPKQVIVVATAIQVATV